MKKCSIMLSVLAMLCSSMTLQTISVSALEAATTEEMYMQNQETQEFPDPSATYTKAVENNLEFRLYADYAVLTKCNDREVTAVEIPAEINGLPVVGAIDSPFGYCRKLQKITLPDSFEHFVWLDLICTTAQRINMGSVGAHSGVIQIAAVDAEDETLIPSVSEVVVSETNPFYTTVDGVLYTKDMKTLIGCPPAKEMQSLNIPEQTERIGGYAFVGCYHLENAVIPSNITHINNGAFAVCINLKSIAFPKHITSISGDMCYNCESLSDITFNGDIDTIGYGAFRKCSALETFEIPDTVIELGQYAFAECDVLETVTLPKDIQTVGYRSFSSCPSLTCITIPKRVTSAGGAFAFSGITDISFEEGTEVIPESIFENCDALQEITITFSQKFFQLRDLQCRELQPVSLMTV